MRRLRIRKRFIFTVILVLAIAGITWAVLANRKPKIEYTTVKAVRGKLIQTVSETGTIKPIDQLELNFLSPGKLAVINTDVGKQIKSGDSLAKLDDSDYLIKAREAEANLTVAQAKLNKLLAGASSEDIAVAEANYQAAQDNLDKTQTSNAEAVAQAQQTYDDLINQTAGGTKSTYRQSYDNKVDALLTTLDNKLIVGVAALDAVKRLTDDTNLKNYLSVRNDAYLINTKSTYILADNALDAANAKRPADASDIAGLTAYYNSMISALNLVFKDLNYCFNALEYSITAVDFSQATLDADKTTISTQSTTISTAVASLQAAKQALDDAKVALDNATISAKNTLATAKITATKTNSAASAGLKTAEAQLKQITAKARSEDVALARAQVSQAQSSLDLIRNQMANDTIKAPIDGIVSQVNYKVGEQTMTTKPVIVMIAQNHYEIEIDVAETDIAKIKLDDPAAVTLDAYGDSVKFEGKVIFIEPAETVIQGVTYYKVKVDFTPGDKEVKPGMTATAEIKTAAKDDTLMVPARAVVDKEGNKYVRVLNGQTMTEVPVNLGLSGDGGMVEVISGVKEGDEIITYIKDNTKTTN